MNLPSMDDDIAPPPGGWAIVSWVCGVVGCLGFTPFVAIFAGVMGMRQGGPGKKLARLGLLLGVLWVAGFVVFGGVGVVVSRHGATWLAQLQRTRTIGLINALPNGQTAPPDRIGRSRAAELAAMVQDNGVCRDLIVSRGEFTNRDGVFGIELYGTAVFDRGRRAVRVRLFFNGTGWGVSELDWL